MLEIGQEFSTGWKFGEGKTTGELDMTTMHKKYVTQDSHQCRQGVSVSRNTALKWTVVADLGTRGKVGAGKRQVWSEMRCRRHPCLQVTGDKADSFFGQREGNAFQMGITADKGSEVRMREEGSV